VFILRREGGARQRPDAGQAGWHGPVFVLQQVRAEHEAWAEAAQSKVDRALPEAEGEGLRERTFVMVKPDGVAKGLTDEIVRRIKQAGLKITSMRQVRMNRQTAEKLYEVHRGKEFFERLVEHVLSGDVVAMLVEGERAVARMRELVGETDPAKAAKGTIRGDFGSSITENIIHAADSTESAKRELVLFF